MSGTTYQVLKAKVCPLVMTSTASSDEQARAQGYLDVFDKLIADHDGCYQPHFLTMLPREIAERGDQFVLLDGMASEYAIARGWLNYLHTEHWRR